MKLELPPPIPAKRASPRKVERPPRNEASPSGKPLPAVSSPPPVQSAPSTPAPSNEDARKPAEAGESPWLVVGFTVLGLGLMIALGISSSSTQTVPSNSGSYSAPMTETPVPDTPTADSDQSPATAFTPESSPAPSPSIDEVERRLEDMRKRYAPAFSAASPTTSSEPVQPTPAPPQMYRVVNVDRGDYLKVRSGPAQTYPVVATLPPGSGGILLLPGRIANGSTMWQEISAGGSTGWVNEIYLEPVFPRAVEVR
jgi:hypothetical protein